MDSHGISDRGNGGDDNKLLLSNLISKENCLSRQYSIGSKKEANTSDLKLEHHLFSYVDKEHYTTKIGRPLAGLVATSIPKPSNGSYLLRRCPTPTLRIAFFTLSLTLQLHKALKKRGLNPNNVEWFVD